MNFLSKIPRLIKSRAAREGAIVLIDQGMMSMVTFVTGVLIVRSAPESSYALYMLGWTVLLSFKGVQEALVNLPFTVYSPRLEADEFSRYHGSTLLISAIFCVLAVMVSLVLFELNENSVFGGDIALFERVPLLALLLSAFVMKDYLRNALLAQLKVWDSVRVNVSASIAILLAISYMYSIGSLHPEFAYIAFSIAFLFAGFSMFWIQRTSYNFECGSLLTHFRKNWSLGSWALIGNFAYLGARQSYPWMILYFLDYGAVAEYYAYLTLALAPGPILRGAGAYLLPRMSDARKDGSTDNLVRILKKSMAVLCVPYLLWLAVGAFFGAELITLLYADKFNESTLLFILLLIMATIDFVLAPLTNALQTMERTREIAISLFYGAALSLLTGALLIPVFGLIGAGASSIISMSGTMLYRIYVFNAKVAENGSAA